VGARLVIAALSTAIVVALGALVASRWLGAPPPVASPPAPVTAPAATATTATTAAGKPEAGSESRAVVTAVVGAPTRAHGAAPAVPLRSGDVLDDGDVVTTGESDAASLKLGGAADVDVAGGTQLSVGAIRDRVSRVRLRDGRIAAVVHGHDAALRVESGEAAAESDAGAFSVLAADGQVTLATTQGRARLTAHNRTVEVGAGFQSRASHGAAPSAPAAIPPSLFIKLAPPRATMQRERQTVVAGRTAPGAVVTVNGVQVVAGESGEFSRLVPLREGKNVLRVETRDVLGRKSAQSLPAITVDSKAPDVRAKVKW
jgi:Glucodextranase, domain B/FecR protein